MKKRNLLGFFLLITILATIAVLTSCKKNDINNFTHGLFYFTIY